MTAFVSKAITDPSLIFNIMGAEPYSTQYRQDVNSAWEARITMRLRTIPNDVAAYVKQRAPTLAPFDWWWTRGHDETHDWIEVSIRIDASIKLEQGFITEPSSSR